MILFFLKKKVNRVEKSKRKMTFYSCVCMFYFLIVFLTFFFSYIFYVFFGNLFSTFFVPLPPRARKIFGNQKTAVFLCERVDKKRKIVETHVKKKHVEKIKRGGKKVKKSVEKR